MRGQPLVLARWIALGVPAALLAGALGSQFIGGLYPCEMCHWQRWPHYAAVVIAGASFLVQRSDMQRLLILLAGVAIGTSGAIGVFHAGVEYGWWQGITACSAPPAAASVEELLSRITQAPIVRCDTAPWTLMGISLAGYNALVSLGTAFAIFWLATRKARAWA